jgi:hypothetical protein
LTDYGVTFRFKGLLGGGVAGEGCPLFEPLHAEGMGPSMLSMVAVTSTAARPDCTMALAIL